MKKTPSENNSQSKLCQVRILQKHIVYVIGISPAIAKEETLKKYEFFGQYGKIQQITINKENAFDSENQGICFSVYICYSTPSEASLAILAVDQFVYDGRLIRASFGRTKYCKFFLKESQCLNRDCPYLHYFCDDTAEIVKQDDNQKKQLFQQCQLLAFQLSEIGTIPEDKFKQQIQKMREQLNINYNTNHRMPSIESIFDKKNLFKQCLPICKPKIQTQTNQRKFTNEPIITKPHTEQFKERTMSNQYQVKESSMIQKEIKSPLIVKQLPIEQKSQDTHKSPNIKNDLSRQFNSDIKQQKRNNSSDERRRSKTKDLEIKQRVYNMEQQLVNKLKIHLSPSGKDEYHLNDNNTSNNQMSIFNEKKVSRFFSLNQEEEEEQPKTQESLFKSRSPRSPSVGQRYQKNDSFQSLIIEQLKFLNDDTDVVPAKRLPLIQNRTSPPSEFVQETTPLPSHFGGYLDDDALWDGTVFSNQEYNAYRKTVCAFDNSSYYSHQFNNAKTTLEKRNSLLTQSYYNNYPLRSAMFNDSIQNTQSNSNQMMGNMRNMFYQMGQNINNTSRKTIGQHNQNEKLMCEGITVPLQRSPSQPNIDNSGNIVNQQQLLMDKQKSIPQQRQFLDSSYTSKMNTSSYDNPFPLNKYNLDLFDKQTSKDIIFAKIFSKDNAFISSQSLFCYNYSLFDANEKNTKYSERQIPCTPIKGHYTEDNEYDDQFQFIDDDSHTFKNSEPKNYYQEYMSIKDVFNSFSMRTKRRNSFHQETEKLQPQQLQFDSPTQYVDDQVNKQRSKSRSQQRKVSVQRD